MKYVKPFTSISRKLSLTVLPIFLLFTAQTFGTTTRGTIAPGSGDDLVPSGKGWGVSRDMANFPGNGAPGKKGGPGGGSTSTNNGINYHGGPLITSGPNIYYIYYGDWSKYTTAQSILGSFASSIGGSKYFNINTTYYNGSNTPVTNSVTLSGNIAPSGPYNTSLSDSDIQAIVTNNLSSKNLPADANGVYFVLTAPDVHESSGFCTKYCGWHTHTTFAGIPIKYSFVGNPVTQCLSSCSAQTTSSPNGDLGADAMVNVIAHELEEATTDPQLNAWYDRRGYENADKCAWKFGTTYTVTNGSKANMKLKDGNDYLIQQNWLNAGGGGCTLSY